MADGKNSAMRIAVIDLGTHTALLLIADIDKSSQISIIRQEQRIVGLGKGATASGLISDESLSNAIKALTEFVAIIQTEQVHTIRLVGTAALREAANTEYVKTRIFAETGLLLTVISGKEEAELVYRAGTRAFKLPEKKTVIDIGGGSVEFVSGVGPIINKATSLPLGVVKLTERFITSFPADEVELGTLRTAALALMQESLAGYPVGSSAGILIGVAGTFTTAAAMIMRLTEYDAAKITGFILKRKEVSELLACVAKLTIEEQKLLPGLHPKRAGLIVSGLSLIDLFFDYFDTDTITVSDEGLRFGVLLKAVNENAS